VLPAPQAQRRAARHHDFESRRGAQQVGQERRRVEQVLEVVEHGQQVTVAQVQLQRLEQGLCADVAQADRGGM
jgi:hypothetical protein